MTKEIIEVHPTPGITVEQLAKALTDFHGCQIEQTRSEGVHMLYVECDAKEGWIVRNTIERLTAASTSQAA